MNIAKQLKVVQDALQATTDQLALTITEPGDDAASLAVDEGYTALALLGETIKEL